MRFSLLIRDLGYAGAQRQLAVLAQGLQQRGHQVCVFSFYGGPLQAELERAGVKVVCFGKQHRWDMLGFFWRVVSGLRHERPEVLYTFLNESNVLAALLRPLLPGTRLVWGLRDSEPDAALYGWLGRLAFQLARVLSCVPDQIIANSHCGARRYAEIGYPHENMQVVHNGFDLERFARDADARERVRAEFGVKADEVLFGIVGRLTPIKDHAMFFKAAAQVPRARILCVGSGSEGYTRQLQDLAKELHVPVLWSPQRSDMTAVYSALDALVSSSLGEGFSNVIGEAMACDTPCIVTDVGDSALLVAETGLVVPPDNPEALAVAMRGFMQSKPTASPRQRMIDHFAVPAMVESTVKVLSTCVEPPPRRSAMKLLFVTTALGSGGAEMMLTQIVTSLDRSRFESHVISLTDGGKHADTLRAANVSVQSLGMSAGRPSLRSLLKLRALTQHIRPDVLVGWMYHGNLAATLASWFGKRAPVLWNVRQSLYSLALEKRGSALVIKTLAWLGFNPQQVIYNSKVSAQQHEALGYPAAKRVLVPNGFDTARFQPDAEARASVRAELGLQSDAILIGRFGRHSAMKGYPTFIEAMKNVPHAHGIIVGTGTEVGCSHLSASDADKLKGGDEVKIHCLGERNDLPRLTAALDIACSSSAFGEGFPNVVAEAMCCGVPCVVTDVGDSAWLLDGAGTVVPPHDAEALAKALNAMLALTPEQRRALGEMGRRRIMDHFALPAVVPQFESLFSTSEFRHSSPFSNSCAA